MSLTYSTAAQLAPSPVVKLLVHGKSGAGKTYLLARAGSTDPAAKSGRVAILLTEANGLPSIVAANPAAIVIRAYDPAAYGKKYPDEVVVEFVSDAMTGALAAAGVDVIGIDSFTDLQRIWKDRIVREKGQDPAKYLLTQQDWGVWHDKFLRLVRAFRDLPVSVIGTALTKEDADADGNVTLYPLFDGKAIGPNFMQYFSAAGYAFKRSSRVADTPGGPEREVVEHKVLFQGATRFSVKPVAGLRDVEDPEPRAWINACAARALSGHSAPAATAPAATAAPAAAASTPASGSGDDPTAPAPATTTRPRRRLGVGAAATTSPAPAEGK